MRAGELEQRQQAEEELEWRKLKAEEEQERLKAKAEEELELMQVEAGETEHLASPAPRRCESGYTHGPSLHLVGRC